jgi:hypothetical protein
MQKDMRTAKKKQLDGHGDASKWFPRSPRLDFDEACRIA